MKEWTRRQWEKEVAEKEKTAFYLYTPMCGTCQVASRMMEVTEQVMTDLPIGKANLNYMEQLAFDYEIESVPCLIITQGGEVKEKIYAFQSVPHLFDVLSKNY
ncbi:thioredoxin family protein [Kurthia sibirica]|uniref:Thiol reductase thioredoxin n=1 Tax=Kurthia sibirica TaxID=202750 RepID=A0A2U3AIN3_9BACL|nr:thioredoxin family protein [Kurthia sibirica]PWI24395.1 thiol reductase thioredoxin [Kurthia sibirica]GEK33812.1 thiol reductase thioredoxin [Kurthia sibirica]